MANYIDGFAFPIPRARLDDYRKVAEAVAEVWKEHGAIAYREFVGDDLNLEGTRAFPDLLEVSEEEVVVFGWVEFESGEARDRANKSVPTDERMGELVRPLVDPANPVFDATRMVYGGFRHLVSSSGD